MPIEDYRVEAGSQSAILRRIAENSRPGSTPRRFRLSVDGENVVGVPVLEPWSILGNPLKRKVKILGQRGTYVVDIRALGSVEAIDGMVDDQRFMQIAIEESRRSLGEGGRVRPRVGAVLVVDDCELGRAFRGQVVAGEHAEHGLLDRVLREHQGVRGATLYTTLEPCTERTGDDEYPCVHRITERRISRVVVGMLDPNPDIKGEGVWRLRDARVEVSFCAPEQMEEIEDINREFIRAHRGWRRRDEADPANPPVHTATQGTPAPGAGAPLLVNGDEI